MTLLTPQRLLARRLPPFRRLRPDALETLPGCAVRADRIDVLADPAAFRQRLLQAIAGAQRRILLVALYLEDDDAGRELLQALHATRQARPHLRIDVLVDAHRARRGRIGAAPSAGNAAMYRAMAARHGDGVAIHGVPVQQRELFGVMHLKGHVIDDTVFYSGASFNDVYLARHGRYRLDRYCVLDDATLAHSLAEYVDTQLLASPAVQRLDREGTPAPRELAAAIRELRQQLRLARYHLDAPQATGSGDVHVVPLAGFGRRDNALNDVILMLLRQARERVVLLTPYFNLPRPVRAALGQLLRRGCRIEILVGDKHASDFYIPPGQPFSKIGLLPYLYEANLRRFLASHRRHLERGQLVVRLWRHERNSFHVKGMCADGRDMLLTGHNLNPRAWALDLENGLLLRDREGRLAARWEAEWQHLCRHATRLRSVADVPSARTYPPEVRRLLKRMRRLRFDHLLRRLL